MPNLRSIATPTFSIKVRQDRITRFGHWEWEKISIWVDTDIDIVANTWWKTWFFGLRWGDYFFSHLRAGPLTHDYYFIEVLMRPVNSMVIHILYFSLINTLQESHIKSRFFWLLIMIRPSGTIPSFPISCYHNHITGSFSLKEVLLIDASTGFTNIRS